MCGRYTLVLERADVEDRFGARFASDDGPAFAPRYNAAPGQSLPVITDEAPETIRRLEWGLVPSWADGDVDGLINARAETVAEKPSFRPAYEQRRPADETGETSNDEPAAGRCLVLADGFYEWVDDERADGRKQPYRVTLEDDGPFAMAGLWERWTPETGQTGLDAFGGGIDGDGAAPIETFTVVTTAPNDLVADLHHRMAAILEPETERRWLTGEDPRDLLEPRSADGMRAYPVSTAVNDPSVDEPSLVAPLEA